jgi:hypothetical protein
MMTQPLTCVQVIGEGRAASKSPHQKFGYFLSMSQQAVSAISFQIQLLEYFPQKQKEQRHKKLGDTDTDTYS